jgi:hypothetical protein
LNFCPNEYSFICHFSITPQKVLPMEKGESFLKTN